MRTCSPYSLYSEALGSAFAVGKRILVQIRMPLSKASMQDVDLRIIPRRCEPESSYFKVGCSLDSPDATILALINEIISNYTIDKGLDLAVNAGSADETNSLPEAELEEL